MLFDSSEQLWREGDKNYYSALCDQGEFGTQVSMHDGNHGRIFVGLS